MLQPEKIKISEFIFDSEHINKERNHNITVDEVKKLIEEADIALERWNGRFMNYYGDNGSVYVDLENKVIRTAFKSDEYDENTKKLREVARKYGK